MTLMLSVSGCRGIVGESLTPEVAARFAASFVSTLRDSAGGKPVTIVLGRDGRAGGHMIHLAAVAGLVSAGAHVTDLGITTTPSVAVATDDAAQANPNDLIAGMVLTASHNPQQWNGLKCLLRTPGDHVSASAPPARIANRIIETFQADRALRASWDALGDVSISDSAATLHVDRVMQALEAGGFDNPQSLAEDMNVVIDSVNASGFEASGAMMEAMGVRELLHLGAEETGIFPHPPEPTEQNLGMPGGLCEAVREQAADVGFAQDPDADRLAIVDETGRYIGEEYTLALCARAILTAHRRSGNSTEGVRLVTNLSTSRMLDDVCAGFNARVLRTPVGEANVVEVMKREGALAGGEGNGGIIWPRVCFVRDSIAGMALILWLISPQGAGEGRKLSLSQLVNEMPSYAIRKRKVDLAKREDAAPALERIASLMSRHAVDRSDGVWVNMEASRSWLHVRPSNTEPILRLIAEAPTPAEADAILDEAQNLL